MKKILVPIDFSKNSDNALDFARAFSEKINAEIILLHVYGIPFANAYISYDLFAKEMAEAKKESDFHLKKLANKIKDDSGISCKVVSVHDLVVDAILKESAKERADLIVMGTKGASNIPGIIMGSTTTAMIEKAECPLLTVPENCHFSELQNIAIATDYHEKNFQFLKKIIDLFKPFNAAISLVHVSEGNEKNSSDLIAAFSKVIFEKTGLAPVSNIVLPPGDTEEQLEIFIKENSIDLLVVSPRHHNFFERFFGRSLTRKMTYHANIPLLSFH